MINLTNALEMPNGEKYGFFGQPFYGTSSSQAAVKDASVPGFTSDNLVEGAHVFIKFTYKPVVSDTDGIQASLNVQGTGAKTIAYVDTDNTIPYNAWDEGEIVEFIYNGTKWIMMKTPKVWYGKCTTAGGVGEKMINIPGFNVSKHLTNGTIIAVDFSYDNTASNSYANINGTHIGYIDSYAIQSSGVCCFICYGQTNSNKYLMPISGYIEQTGSSPYFAASAQYVSQKYTKPAGGIPASDIASGVIPSVYNSSTNPNGYLTMSTLPIYDGTVV